MPNFDTWLASGDLRPATAAQRAVMAWQRIQDRSTSVVLKRNNVAQSAQTMRVELGTGAGEGGGENATPGRMSAVLFGVRSHPTVTDTSIQRGDRVVINNFEFEVVGLVYPPGEVQAFCEVIG
jgi:hypothetical protein